jgi:hypothetical protein
MDINANRQNKQKNDKNDDGVASQCKKKRMCKIMKVAHPKKKTWQRDLKMMKALKGTKTPKENIENGKDKFKKKAKQKSLHYFT